MVSHLAIDRKYGFNPLNIYINRVKIGYKTNKFLNAWVWFYIQFLTPRGCMLLNVIQNIICKCISPPGPTYWSSHQNWSPDILDFFLSSIPSNIKFNIYNSNDITSDHNPVILDINSQPIFNFPILHYQKVRWIGINSHPT